MKILIITNHSYMLWQFRRELISKLLENHQVIISTPFVGHEEDFEKLGCQCIETNVDRRGINPLTDLKLLRAYKKLLNEQKPDMVLTYSIKPNIYSGFLCRMKKIAYCANVQGLGTAFQKKGLAKVVSIMYKSALKKAKTVFFENESNASLFTDRGIMKREKQTLLPGAGVNLEYYEEKAYPDNDKLRFLYLGRIMKEKGIDELFSAVRRLHKSLDGKIVLDLVGFYEDEYEETVEKLCREGIAVFHGFQQDPRPYYAAADCIVLPSYHEGMSNVLLEAAATGRAVITSDIPGCREAVEDGKTGYLCKAQDADSLYEAMAGFAAIEKSSRENMGKFGRIKMESCFAKDMVVEKTVSSIFEV